MFGPEYGLCKIIELRTEGKYSVPVTVTTTDAAAKVNESAKSEAEYQKAYFNFVEMDLIVSEFKLHKECQKMLTRPVRPQTDTTRVSHIDWHVIGFENPLEMGTAVKLYLGYDTDEASGESIKKEKTREKETFRLLTEKKTFKLFRRKKF